MLGLVGLFIVAGAAAAFYHQFAQSRQGAAPPQNPAGVPVRTAVAVARDVPVILRGLGQVVAFNTVAVKSRVEGNITKVNFREGQKVRAGDLLIQIDPRPYQAALDQAKAVLAKDQAALVNAEADLQRYSKLLKREFTPEQQYTTQKSTVAQNTATIENDQTQIDAAALNVEYASIKSPVDGITGIRQVDLGNLVQANSNNAQTLVTVTQIEPIYVVFTLPEADIQRVRDAMQGGLLRVQAFDQSDQREIAAGALNLIDNAVDPTTGTVRLKAEFANKDVALWPGQFVNAHLVLETVRNGVNIPSAAVQTGLNGSYAYVVKPDSTVEMRPIKVVQTENNLALIGSGLRVGEEVVTAGQYRLEPGAKVQVSNPLAQGASLSVTPMAEGQSVAR
ncbi:efflux RND transporter periplasmic adaptor subunit [Methylocapsa acidiphila]|uniref:efflux RND transporter periplasmic adaptor subunit n=1 Tax=Methylocapsa acidiphila TaxID=133552 RepID=UPI0003F91A15|nr:efflux RND transporter periplasmic adaptor subunit [Methylocapsa acidiphila]